MLSKQVVILPHSYIYISFTTTYPLQTDCDYIFEASTTVVAFYTQVINHTSTYLLATNISDQEVTLH